jgi:hypothetical protein
VNAPLGDWV